MFTANRVVRDLRALGSSAPIRVAYEASKLTGLHRLLFRGISDESRQHELIPVPLGTYIPTSQIARGRCLSDAKAVLEQGLRVFGRRVRTGVEASWCDDPLTGKSWPTGVPWWRIDIRGESRLSDVKFVWEAGRHRDLVVLARAAVIEPDGPWLEGLGGLLARWCEQQAPERGINWYSSLELALRAIAWDQILALVGERLPTALRSEMKLQLLASARHITIELPYTVSSMKNNHMLGDGLGLLILGRMFPTHPSSRRWVRLGSAVFARQLSRHMRPDGSMIEDSLSYHRFVLEMLIVRSLLGDADDRTRQAIAGAAQHLVALGVLDGPVPQFGDWDEGRVLADSAVAGSTTGSTWLALALTGSNVPVSLWADHDELAWYVPQPVTAPVPKMRCRPDRIDSSGGITFVRQDDWKVWFKTGGGPSHQHADLLSMWVMRGEQWIIRDPGTGTYNGPLHVRNGLRTSAAHPVWRPNNADQLGPHRAFRWMRPTVEGAAALPIEMGHHTLLLGWNGAFQHLAQPVRLARLVVIGLDRVVGVDVADRALHDHERWVMTLPMCEGATEQVFGGEQPRLVRGQSEPFAGWHSETYGEWHPSPWSELASIGDVFPIWGCGSPPQISTEDGLTIDGLRLSFTWSDSGVRAEVRDRCSGVAKTMQAHNAF